MRDFDEIYFIRLFFRILVGFSGLVIVCLIFLEINDSVVFQNGEIMAENPQLDVKAPFEAIPDSVFVKEGQHVKAGDTLLILLNEQLRRDYKGTETMARSLQKDDSTVSELMRNADARMKNLIKEKELNSKAYHDRKERVKSELQSVNKKVELNQEQLYSVALEKLMMDSTLYKQQVISKLEMTNSYDNFSRYKSALVESELTQKQMQAGSTNLDNDFHRSQNALELRVIDLQQRLKELDQQKYQTRKELENVVRNLNYIGEQLKKQYVISTTDGEVQNLFNLKFSQNFVTKDQLLLSVVPHKDKFYARVKVPQRDMRYLKEGQTAHLKVEAYNFYSKGILMGRVAYIPESKPKEDFFVNVELPAETPFDLKAGYSLRGEIIIERMKLYRFIGKKLFRKLEDSTALPSTISPTPGPISKLK
jgi:multidrug efflux pump subunit AcrA (membrane-fusion protein)